jgi:glycosyltransferase involved in cell wall biosynthesis
MDDRSSDDTLEVAHEFARTAAFPVRVERNEHNLGYARNFEETIAQCEGDVIVLSDQDDLWHPEKLAWLEERFAASSRLGLVCSDAMVVDAQLRPLGYSLWSAVQLTKEKRQRLRAGDGFRLLLREQYLTGATMAFRADLRPLLLPIPSGVPHDGWIALLTAAVADLDLIEEPLIQYRQHGQNQIGARRRRRREFYRWAQSEGMSALHALAGQAEAAVERLHGWPGVSAGTLALAAQAARHLSVRAQLPARRFARILPIARELVRGGYQGKYGGLQGGFSDLVIGK